MTPTLRTSVRSSATRRWCLRVTPHSPDPPTLRQVLGYPALVSVRVTPPSPDPPHLRQVLGYPAAQYPALVSAGPPVAGRLVNGQRLRSAESCDDSLLLHPHPLAAPAPAYQRPMPLSE